MVRTVHLSYVLSALIISLEIKQANLTFDCCRFQRLVWLFSCHFTTTFLYLVAKSQYDDLCLADMFSTSPREFSPYVKFYQHDSVSVLRIRPEALSPPLNTACVLQVLLQQTMPSF
jgi:hypothetical protein